MATGVYKISDESQRVFNRWPRFDLDRINQGDSYHCQIELLERHLDDTVMSKADRKRAAYTREHLFNKLAGDNSPWEYRQNGR